MYDNKKILYLGYYFFLQHSRKQKQREMKAISRKMQNRGVHSIYTELNKCPKFFSIYCAILDLATD